MLRRLANVGCKRFVSQSSTVLCIEDKRQLVRRLLQAKDASGLTYDDLARECGLTNVFCAQLLHNQACLSAEMAEKFQRLLPSISSVDLKEMQKIPLRLGDKQLLDDPLIYRFKEVVLMYAHSLKAVIAEKFGDGIMSAIDFKISVETEVGENKEQRVVVKMNGKFLPHVQQKL